MPGGITRTPEWLFGGTESGTTEEVSQEVPIVVQEDIEPPPNLQETVDAGIALTMEAMPTPTIPPSATPLSTPDEETTVQAGVEAGVATTLAQLQHQPPFLLKLLFLPQLGRLVPLLYLHCLKLNLNQEIK